MRNFCKGYMKSTKLLHAVATTPHLLQQLCPSVWQSHELFSGVSCFSGDRSHDPDFHPR